MREVSYTPWETAALTAMRSRPNPDGTFGYVLTDSPQARDWFEYLNANEMAPKAAFLKSRVMGGNPFLVPTEWPDQFDTSWRRGRYSFGFRNPKSDLSPEQRHALAESLRTGFRKPMDEQLAA